MTEATSPYLNRPIRSLALVQSERKPDVLDRDTAERFAKRTRHLKINGQAFESTFAELFGWPE